MKCTGVGNINMNEILYHGINKYDYSAFSEKQNKTVEGMFMDKTATQKCLLLANPANMTNCSRSRVTVTHTKWYYLSFIPHGIWQHNQNFILILVCLTIIFWMGFTVLLCKEHRLEAPTKS